MIEHDWEKIGSVVSKYSANLMGTGSQPNIPKIGGVWILAFQMYGEDIRMVKQKQKGFYGKSYSCKMTDVYYSEVVEGKYRKLLGAGTIDDAS